MQKPYSFLTKWPNSILFFRPKRLKHHTVCAAHTSRACMRAYSLPRWFPLCLQEKLVQKLSERTPQILTKLVSLITLKKTSILDNNFPSPTAAPGIKREHGRNKFRLAKKFSISLFLKRWTEINNWRAIEVSIIKYIFRKNKPIINLKNTTRLWKISTKVLAAHVCSVSATVLSNNYQAETTRQKKNNLQFEGSSLVLGGRLLCSYFGHSIECRASSKPLNLWFVHRVIQLELVLASIFVFDHALHGLLKEKWTDLRTRSKELKPLSRFS